MNVDRSGWEYKQHSSRNALSRFRARRPGESLVVVREDFWASTSNKQLNFLQHVKSCLNELLGMFFSKVIPFVGVCNKANRTNLVVT